MNDLNENSFLYSCTACLWSQHVPVVLLELPGNHRQTKPQPPWSVQSSGKQINNNKKLDNFSSYKCSEEEHTTVWHGCLGLGRPFYMEWSFKKVCWEGVTFELWSEAWKGTSTQNFRVRVPGRGTNKYKYPGAGMNVLCSRKKKVQPQWTLKWRRKWDKTSWGNSWVRLG